MNVDFATADNAPKPRVEIYDEDTGSTLAVIYIGKDVPTARAEALAELILTALRALPSEGEVLS